MRVFINPYSQFFLFLGMFFWSVWGWTAVAIATPVISGVSDNRATYTNQQIPKYEKFEITFQVQTQAQNLQFPYLAPSQAGSYLQKFVDQGITVDAIFTDPTGQEFKQPAFYYQKFDESLSGTNEWYYPTDEYSWKVRFSPNQAGTWKYRLQATDKSGTQTSTEINFLDSSQ
jgi:hypothetical protein